MDYVTPAISVFTSLWNGYQARKASEAATAAQVAAGGKAQAQLDATYKASSANYAPYLALGAGGAATLGNVMGFAGSGAYPASQPAGLGAAPAPYTPPPQQPAPTPPPAPMPTPQGPEPIPADTVGPPSMPLQQAMLSPAQVQTQSGYVRMQAPDGSVDSVKQESVPHFQQRGARVIA